MSWCHSEYPVLDRILTESPLTFWPFVIFYALLIGIVNLSLSKNSATTILVAYINMKIIVYCNGASWPQNMGVLKLCLLSVSDNARSHCAFSELLFKSIICRLPLTFRRDAPGILLRRSSWSSEFSDRCYKRSNSFCMTFDITSLCCWAATLLFCIQIKKVFFLILTLYFCLQPLPDSILCSDTLHAFRELQILDKPPPWHIPLEVIEPYSPPPRDIDNWMNQSSTEICRIMDELEKDLHIDDSKIKMIDPFGKTPKRGIPREQPPPMRRVSVPQGPPSPRPMTSVRKNLFGTPTKKGPQKPSYKLENVYRHLMKKGIPNAHSAEGDSLAILDCIAAIGPPFHTWVENNHRKLSSILKLW